jgi:hypothetical protein
MESTDSFRSFDSDEKWELCVAGSPGGLGR